MLPDLQKYLVLQIIHWTINTPVGRALSCKRHMLLALNSVGDVRFTLVYITVIKRWMQPIEGTTYLNFTLNPDWSCTVYRYSLPEYIVLGEHQMPLVGLGDFEYIPANMNHSD